MGNWLFMLIINSLIPLIMIVFGWSFMKKPPKKINGIYGYRTTMSMKNRDTWDFAHRYCGEIWFKLGWIVMLLSAVIMLLVLGKEENIIGSWGSMLCLLQCVILVGTIFPTERALKSTFDKNGIRKNSKDH